MIGVVLGEEEEEEAAGRSVNSDVSGVDAVVDELEEEEVVVVVDVEFKRERTVGEVS